MIKFGYIGIFGYSDGSTFGYRLRAPKDTSKRFASTKSGKVITSSIPVSKRDIKQARNANNLARSNPKPAYHTVVNNGRQLVKKIVCN